MSYRAIRASAPTGADAPIDLGHLRAQTCGDADLEADLLELFSRQARTILRDLAGTAPNPAMRTRADLLHTLCGSARAVGAWEVATGAEQLERITRGAADPAPADGPSGPDNLMAALDGSVERACRAIDNLRATDCGSRNEAPSTRR